MSASRLLSVALCSYKVGTAWSHFTCYPAFHSTLHPTYTYTCTPPNLHSFYTVFDLSETSAQLASFLRLSVPTKLERLGPISPTTLHFIVRYTLPIYISFRARARDYRRGSEPSKGRVHSPG